MAKSRSVRIKERDPEKPRRPISSYFQFIADQRQALSAELGADCNRNSFSSLAAERWKTLPEGEKTAYQDKWAKAMKKYTRKLEEYKASGAEQRFTEARREATAATLAPATLAKGSAAPSTPPVRGVFAVDLSQVPTAELVLELARRHGLADLAGRGAEARQAEEQPAPKRRRHAARAATPATPKQPPNQQQSYATAVVTAPKPAGLPAGLHLWLTAKRRARIAAELEVEENHVRVLKEAKARWAALDEERRAKFEQRAAGGGGDL